MKHAKIMLLCLAVTALALCARRATGAVEREPRPNQDVPLADCSSAGCHADVKKHDLLHGPVNVNACDACHTLADAAKHTYELSRPKTDLCTFCHQMDLKSAKVVHKPLLDGDCAQCHDPHGGNNRQFIRGASMAEACNSCHQDVTAKKTVVHGPVAAGACGACHSPHTAEHPKLLVAQGRDLCVSCHREMDAQLANVKFRHKALDGDCQDCHDPHAANHKMLVKQEPIELCTSCHGDVKAAVHDAPHKHSIVTADKACLNCHNAHGSNLAQLMKQEPIKICLNCHEKPIQVSKERTIASVAEVKDPKLVKHGPIRDGECTGCHAPHGGAVQKLLNKPYPPTFYEAFDEEAYALCFGCHNKQLALAEKTSTETRFRNGDHNLHYLHVNKQERGRTCRACHSTHASTLSMHLRDSVPYGKWDMPVTYTPTETGGGCSPGCHKPYEYDRVNPVTYTRPGQGAAAVQEAKR